MAPRKKRYRNLCHDDEGRFVKRATPVVENNGDDHTEQGMVPEVLTESEKLDMKRNYMANKRFRQKAYAAIRLAMRNALHYEKRVSGNSNNRDAPDERIPQDPVQTALAKLEIINSNRGVDKFRFQKLASEWLYDFDDTCPNLELFATSDGRGIGVRATAPIKKKDFIIEYVGELIPEIECDEASDQSYMFELRGTALFENRRTKVYIDPRHAGNWARFINHHCDANCAAYSVADGTTRRVAIIAYKDIAPGEELTYAYTNNVQYFRKHFRCECGAKKCISKKM